MDRGQPVLMPRGLTAIEVVVATAILSVLMAGFFTMLASQNRMLSDTIVDTHVQTELRRTMDALIEEISASRYHSLSRVTTPVGMAPYSCPPSTAVFDLNTLRTLSPVGSTTIPTTISGDCYTYWLPQVDQVRRTNGAWVGGTGRMVDNGWNAVTKTANPTQFGYYDGDNAWQAGTLTTRMLSIYWIPTNEPEDTISEGVFGIDINADGDMTDVFQIGTLSVVRQGDVNYRRDLGRVACQAGQPRQIFSLLEAPSSGANIGEFFQWAGSPQTTHGTYKQDDLRKAAAAGYADNNGNKRLDLVMEIRLLVIDASQAARNRTRMKVKQQTTRVRLPNTW